MQQLTFNLKSMTEDFSGGSVLKNLPSNTRDMGSIPDPEDPTSLGATTSACHNYLACALKLRSCTY